MTSEKKPIDSSLDTLLNQHFAGKVVRKDLTKLLKEGANVPVYVLEYLLGTYCASNDESVIQDGLKTVKRILAENYVRPDEAEKVKSTVRERGSLKVIDKVTVTLNEKRDVYEALLANLGVKGVVVSNTFVKKFEKLLVGGIWCIVTLEYFYEEEQRGSPFILRDLKPIQMPNLELEELFQGRRAFTEEQWIDVLLRSTGMEPTNFTERVKWHLLARMVPLVENNFNVCELGPRGTGKSHIYKEISPNSILISGGQTTVANLFYNMARNTVGLVGHWDVVAFDEVAGISFKDKDGVQIMKDFMASGSFARGRDAINAYASMVFVGNINQPVDTLVKTSHLFAPFPEPMIDAAFFDRFHAYIPGWEIPKMRPEFFTNQYGLIVDYLAEWMREMRKRTFGDSINKFFKLGRDLNQRDTIAVKRTVSGLLKLLYPAGRLPERSRAPMPGIRPRIPTPGQGTTEEDRRHGVLRCAFQFYRHRDDGGEVHHGARAGGGTLIADGPLSPGIMHTIATGSGGHLGLYRLETQVTAGNGSLKTSGLGSNSTAREAIKVGFDFFKANASRISASIKVGDHDYHLHVVELHNSGPTAALTLSTFVALSSGVMGRPIQQQMVVLGSMSLGGNIVPVQNLAESLQVALDSGARRILLPMASVRDIPTIPGELFAKFQTSFYSDPTDAVFKALGVQ